MAFFSCFHPVANVMTTLDAMTIGSITALSELGTTKVAIQFLVADWSESKELKL